MLGSGDSSHIIKLRGLPFTTTEDDVLNFLSGVNVVNGKDGVHLTETKPGRRSGECFVEVMTQQDVDLALMKDKENMGNRYIEVFSTNRGDMAWSLNAPMRNSENGFGGMPNVTDNMWVVKLRGLPFGCSKEEIVQFFHGLAVAPYGVRLLSDETGQDTGEAFVHFDDQQSVQAALSKDREKIGHRYIEVFALDDFGNPTRPTPNFAGPTWENDRCGNSPVKSEMLGSGDSSHIIKLRGLPFSTTVDDVLDFLSGVNVVNEKDGVHLTEVRPGRPSGECFVEVMNQEDVDEALKKDKENMGKRYIEVFSTDRQDMEWALNAMRQTENGFGGLPNVTDDMGIVKLRGLPFGCSKEEIVQFFNGLEVAPDGVHLLSDHTGRASGEAFVHFNDKESAQDALSRDREKIGHRYIEVFPSSADEVRSYASRGDGGPRGGRGPRPTPYDRGDRFTAGRFGRGGGRGAYGGGGGGGFGSRGGGGGGGFRARGGNHAVHMRGLPFKASPQDIAYFFKPIRPVNINILYDNSGRPSGEADVDFECHEDAMRAMRRDKNNMEHRYIELFLNSSGGGGNGGGNFKPNRTFRNY